MLKGLYIFLLTLFFLSCSEEKPIVHGDIKSVLFNDKNEIRYYEKIYHKTYGTYKVKKDCAEISIEYPEIISVGASFDSVNNYIQTKIHSLSFNEDKYESLDEISDSLFSNYIDVQREFKDYHTGWYIKSKIVVLGIFHNILSLKSEETIYTGGANIFYNLSYTNFDISDGTIVQLSDVIAKKDIPRINSIGEKIFHKLKKIKPNKSEKDAGYWFKNNKFELNNNFAISDSGLVFFYNLYEIAPKSKGTTELFIPRKKIYNFTKIFK